MRNNYGIGFVALAAVLGLSACSASETAGETATGLIEGELSETFGLGTLEGSCEEPENEDVGSTFVCTGTTGDQVIEFLATIDREDHVNVASTNVLLAEDMPTLEVAAVDALNTEFDFGLAPDDIDCGTELVVLDASQELVCGLTETATGDVYDATLTITDISQGAFDIVVADAPRP